MRNLARDTQEVWISRYIRTENGTDAQGRLTGHPVKVMSEPEPFYPSVTLAKGEDEAANFGLSIDYDRVLTLADPSFECSESDYLWIDKPVGGPHDHIVRRIGRKGGYTVIAASRVEVRQ